MPDLNKWVLISSVVVPVPAPAVSVWWLIADAGYQRLMAEAEAAWSDIAGRAVAPEETFEPAMVADMPEIARRYFAHAIAPGAALAPSSMPPSSKRGIGERHLGACPTEAIDMSQGIHGGTAHAWNWQSTSAGGDAIFAERPQKFI